MTTRIEAEWFPPRPGQPKEQDLLIDRVCDGGVSLRVARRGSSPNIKHVLLLRKEQVAALRDYLIKELEHGSTD